MKGRVIVLSERPAAAALIVDGVVEDLLAAPRRGLDDPLPGEIYMAERDRPAPGQGAIFMRLGGGAMGYLRQPPKSAGKTFPVQVSTRPEPGKAVPVDARLLVKGRCLILTPGRPGVNVSRQIREADERDRLTAAIGSVPEDLGVIVRSAAAGIAVEDIGAERDALLARLPKPGAGLSGTPLADAFDPAAIGLRDWTGAPPDQILGPGAVLDRLTEAGALIGLEDRTTADESDLLDRFGVWETVAELSRPLSALTGGGSIAVEPTRALVAVDVNSGAAFSGGAALSANHAAVRALPRQLRLRGLGGQVVVDFAPLKKGERKGIEAALSGALKTDPVETSVIGWTALGHLEMTRKRERLPIGETVLTDV